ncbi:hypothetical protein [Cupriavidus necator]|uniref:hypothetical protein n=1 Tax=Cupriavidus necator TaxID=106590 RepID=UPI00339D8439
MLFAVGFALSSGISISFALVDGTGNGTAVWIGGRYWLFSVDAKALQLTAIAGPAWRDTFAM